MSHNGLRARNLAPITLLGTIIGIAGTDLVLPALPSFVVSADDNSSLVHLVVISYVIGFATGLALFAELYHKYSFIVVARIAVVLFITSSGVLSLIDSIEWIIVIRFVQGVAGASPAVAAPFVIRSIYGDRDASGMVSVFAGLEALVPAGAPVIGYILVEKFGVSSIFVALCLMSIIQLLLLLRISGTFGRAVAHTQGSGISGYTSLLAQPQFLRYALSHALSLAAVLTITFSAPLLFYVTLDGSVRDFILMQVTGIIGFIGAAVIIGQSPGEAVGHSSVRVGSVVMLVGASALFCIAAFDWLNVQMTIMAFVVMNTGLGIRVPKGFVAAIILSNDEPRASALMLLLTMGIAGAGTYLAGSSGDVNPLYISIIVVSMIGSSAILSRGQRE